MACGVYRGINSLEHLIKILERVLEQQLRDITEVDSMHFCTAFSKGKGTTGAVFVVKQLQEKHLEERSVLHLCRP